MHALLGCLFILIFGVFLFVIGIFKLLMNWIFGGTSRPNPWNRTNGPQYNHTNNRNTSSSQRNSQSENHSDYKSGNAHHENSGGSRNSNGKIFEKNEGEYVDFEEV